MIVVDTHAWVWWVAGSKELSNRARRELEAARRIGIPAISLWEVAMLVAKGRWQFDRPVEQWLEQALAAPNVELLPLDAAVAARSTELPPTFHGDPSDRLIVATALVHRTALVSKDAKIRRLRELEVIW